MTRILSCGVIVTDGHHVLIGHATQSPRWDIPKGQAEACEAPEAAARRELGEETGLDAGSAQLVSLGQHRYLPRKDLALYAWLVAMMPDPATLACRSVFYRGDRALPEFDRFACPAWTDAMPKLGASMKAVLHRITSEQGWIGTEPR